MARINYMVSVDRAGMQPMHDCIESLANALQDAEWRGDVPLAASTEGLRFKSEIVAAMRASGPRKGVVSIFVTPTFRMPLFASEMCRLVPGLKVFWIDGWPHFSVSKGRDRVEATPGPMIPASERVV